MKLMINKGCFENPHKTNELLSDSQAVGTNDQFSIDNINQPDNECINDNRQTENVRETDESMPNDQQSITRMLEQTTLANNSTQADNIGSIQDDDN
ncbi:2562_t:CDS:2, partial [Dentiscutata heterogama]